MESQTSNILKDLARMTSSTTGTGTTIALTAADTNCLTFAQAGVLDGDIITYGIDDTGGREVGKAKYNSSGPSLTVQTVYSSTNGGSRINLTGNQKVSVVMSGKDMDSKQDNIEKQIGLIISHGSILLSKGGAVTAGTAPGSVLHASLGPVMRAQTATSIGATASQSGYQSSLAIFKRGSGNYTGGLKCFARVAFGETANATYFIGFSQMNWGSTSANSDNPVGTHCGFWYRPAPSALAHTNIQFMTKDGTTLNSQDTGVALVANEYYDLEFYLIPGDTSVYWKIKRISTGTITTGTKTNNLPSTTQTMLAQFAAVNQTTGVARTLYVQQFRGLVYDPETA